MASGFWASEFGVSGFRVCLITPNSLVFVEDLQKEIIQGAPLNPISPTPQKVGSYLGSRVEEATSRAASEKSAKRKRLSAYSSQGSMGGGSWVQDVFCFFFFFFGGGGVGGV